MNTTLEKCNISLTSDLLNKKIHLVGTSNNDQNPVTFIGEVLNSSGVLHVGYYTSDHSQTGGDGLEKIHYNYDNNPLSCEHDDYEFESERATSMDIH